MTARQRSAMLALLLLPGCLALMLASRAGDHLWAGPRPVPAHTVQAGPVPAEPPLTAPPGAPQPIDPPTPTVSLRVRVPASVAPGQEIEYHIQVENRSAAEAHHVTVRNPLPANARYIRATPEPSSPPPELAWNLGTLAAGTAREIVLVLTPSGPGDIANCARVQFEHGQCVTTRIERPASVLRVRKCGPVQAALNDVLTYKITVTNQGAAPVTHVAIIDKLPDGLEFASGKSTLHWDLGTLAPGQCRSVDYQVTARKAGRLCNHAAASGDGGAFDESDSCVTISAPGVQPAPRIEPVPGAPPVPATPPAGPATAGALTLKKTGPQQRFVGRPATYQVTVTNTGRGVATNVVITDLLPPKTNLVSASDNGRLNNNQVQWLIGTLQAGARRTVQLALQAQEAGEVVNRAAATADGGLTAQDEARTVFEGATGLTFDLEVKDNPVEVGAQTSYIVTIHNQGMAPAAKAAITLTLPEQMQFVAAKGPTNFQQKGQQVIFEPLAALAPQREQRYVITVKALHEGEGKARAELRADQLGDQPVLREQSTTIFADTQGNRPSPAPP